MERKILGFHGGDYEECRFLGCYAVWLLLQPAFLRSVLQMIVTVNVLSSLSLSTLMMEAICSSETSVYIWTTRRYIPEDGNIQNYRYENIKSYTHTEISLSVPSASKKHKQLAANVSHTRKTQTYIAGVRNINTTKLSFMSVWAFMKLLPGDQS
jgi:protein tyrosine phosphatase